MKNRKEWNQNLGTFEDAAAKLEAESLHRGDAYLKYWAAWYRSNPDLPRLKRPMMAVLADGTRYADEVKVRKEAVGVWIEDLAEAVARVVAGASVKEQQVAYAKYLRLRKRTNGNAEWMEHVRAWKDEEAFAKIGMNPRTAWRWLARIRQRVESAADQMDLIPPPDIGY